MFGNIDIYLFYQLMKDRIKPYMRVFDAGCGDGRNIVYLLRNSYEVFAVDQSRSAIEYVRELAKRVAPQLPPTNFRAENIEKLSFSDSSFDFLICSAVLHFANDEDQFLRMIYEMWRVLKEGGIFFSRLASTIGIEDRVKLISGRRYHLPDGSDRFLVDEELIRKLTSDLGGRFLEPIKTTNVENLRCMTTWCIIK
jgi:tellurite methyltransferase